MRSSLTLRHGALALVTIFLAACGGSGNDAQSASDPPTPSITYPATVPATAFVTLDGSGSTASSGRPLTYGWALTSVPAGSTAKLSSVSAAKTSLTADIVGNYGVTLTVDDGLKNKTVSIFLTAITPPTIISDLVEPVSGLVDLALSVDQGTSTVTWTADGNAIGTGATVNWDTTTVANGLHVVAAHVQALANYSFDLSRTFQVAQTTVSFPSETITESAGLFTAIVGAQSVYGIVRIDGTFDGVPFDTLTAPNTCLDPTGAACVATGPNGYSLSGGPIASGAHVAVITATDGIGNTLSTQLRLNVTDVP